MCSVQKTTIQQFSMPNPPNDPYVFGTQTNITKHLWETSHRKKELKQSQENQKDTEEVWEAPQAPARVPWETKQEKTGS